MKYGRIGIVAEIGINHNGDIDKAKKLIQQAAFAGCDYVKFQKRNPDICVPEHMKDKPKKVPWRKEEITYLQYKKDIEFDHDEYFELFKFAKKQKIGLFASVWDLDSAEFMRSFTDVVKIPSALLTDLELIKYCKKYFSKRIISTGMSTQTEINKALKYLDPTVVMHTNSVYPTPVEDLNLGYINFLLKLSKKQGFSVGFSSHYINIVPCFAAIGMGVKLIEVHFCENKKDWGSDQSSSIEFDMLIDLVHGIKEIELGLAKGFEPRTIYPGEEKKRKSLRK